MLLGVLSYYCLSPSLGPAYLFYSGLVSGAHQKAHGKDTASCLELLPPPGNPSSPSYLNDSFFHFC